MRADMARKEQAGDKEENLSFKEKRRHTQSVDTYLMNDLPHMQKRFKNSTLTLRKGKLIGGEKWSGQWGPL